MIWRAHTHTEETEREREVGKYQFHTGKPGQAMQYLFIFGSFCQIKSGVDLSGTLVTEGGQLKGHRFSQAVTGL